MSLTKIAIVILLLYGHHAAAFIDINSDNEIDQLIVKTDRFKSSSRESFLENIDKLNEFYSSGTPLQKDYINYLRVYQSVLDGNFDAAKIAYAELSEQVGSLSVKAISKATLANLQAISGQYDQALANLDIAINLAEEISKESLRNRIYLVSSTVYSLLGIYEMSIKYTDLILNNNPQQSLVCKASSINLRAKIKSGFIPDEDKLHDVIKNCNQVKGYADAHILKLDWLHDELNKAHEENNKKLIGALLNLLKKSSTDIEHIGYSNLIGLKDMVLAKAYYFNGDTDLAVENANKCIDGSKNSGKTYQLVECLKILLLEAEARKDFQKAFQLSKSINEVENEIFSETKAKQMAYMSVKHNSLAKEFEIERLNKNNQLLSLENELAHESSSRQKLLVALISLLLILLGVSTYRIKKRQDYFKKIADIDHLTQVFSRKAFEERMQVLLKTSGLQNKPLNLAIMDLDHFKNINDQFGHQVGDWVLKQVVITCENVLDEDVLMARLGGEEFAIVTPSISLSKSIELLEKIRGAIATMDCSESGYEIKVTASFGVTSTLRSGLSLSSLMADADKALFVAKHHGRNQVRVFEGHVKSA